MISHCIVQKMHDYLIPLQCYKRMQNHEEGLKVVQTIKDIAKEISSLGPNQAQIEPKLLQEVAKYEAHFKAAQAKISRAQRKTVAKKVTAGIIVVSAIAVLTMGILSMRRRNGK